MIVDIHCHYIPERYIDFVQREAAFGVRRHGIDDQSEDVPVTVGALTFGLNRTFFDPDRQIKRLDALRIDRTVLSLATPLINYDVPGDLAIAAARIFNDEIALLRDRHPERIDGWAFLPMQDPLAAARELRRGITSLGLRGGHIASNVRGRYLDAIEYAPIFETAVELDVPLFVHPANPPGMERMRNYELAVVSGYLFDSTLNIFNMIFGGLLDRDPTLKLVCAHVGGYAVMLRNRMQRELDTNPKLAQSVKGSVTDYLRRLYFDTVCFEEGYIRMAADTVGANRLLLGSDGPFPLGEPDPVGFIERSFGDSVIGRDILHHNAAALLGVAHART
jgi:aminocarboxymuconate-semialdehyde decarboxylase